VDSTFFDPDSTAILTDTIPFVELDTSIVDTLQKPASKREIKTEVIVSPDAFDDEIEWGSTDTMWFDREQNAVHLYGSAYVNFQSKKLTAGYILFDFDKKEALASPLKDPFGKDVEKPQFEDGSQSMSAHKIRYNFSSQKAKIYNAITKEGEMFIHGTETKYISKEADTINHVETIYATDGIITSCDADHPHFGIHARKLKVVPNKLAVLGFSNIEIMDIPTPLVIPFGFYPMFQNQRSGLIIPKDYVFDEKLGYGFNGIGVYFPINDFYDLKITSDIYTRGSWGLNVTSNYKKRYKYSGNVNVSYFNARVEQPGSFDKVSSHKFKLRLSHNQDPKAHPYQRFGGSIDFTLNGYDQTFSTDAATRLKNLTTSNLSYSNELPGTIFSFNAGLQHSQNTQSGKISISFPVAKLNMKTYFPFKREKSVGSEKWYEKISIRYNADAKNLIDATDSTLFTRQTIENAQYGLKHQASSSASFSAFKYFTVTPSVNYNEIFFFKEREISFDPTTRYDTTGYDVDGLPVLDTIYGEVLIDTINSFKPYRDFSTSVSMSTKRYGKVLFNKGWLRGIRHVVSYNVGFNYSPNTKRIYEVEIDQDSRMEVEDIQNYNILVRGPYGQGSPRIEQMALNYSIGNNIEGKYFSRKDSTMKKFPILKTFSIRGNYNFAADSLKFSTIALSANTTLFKNLIKIRYSGTLDPYEEVNNRAVNTFVWDTRLRPFRHERSSLDIGTTLTVKQIVEMIVPKKGKDSNAADPDFGQQSSLMDIFGSFRLQYDFGMTWKSDNGVDTFYVDRHVISTRGNIKLSEKWSMTIGHIGYDLLAKKITYPDLGFKRDLHCWQMNFSWRPKAGQYTFYIGVKSTTLEFLKYNHGQSPLETSFGAF
jgi:hypothetical protein